MEGAATTRTWHTSGAIRVLQEQRRHRYVDARRIDDVRHDVAAWTVGSGAVVGEVEVERVEPLAEHVVVVRGEVAVTHWCH